MIEDMKVGDLMRLVEAIGGARARGPAPEDHGMAIVVLDRGFVYVGRTTTDADWCTIRDARNIRIYGTTRGLGELVTEGPKSGTRIDVTGTLKAPMRAVISIHPTEEDLWK